MIALHGQKDHVGSYKLFSFHAIVKVAQLEDKELIQHLILY